jgi:hypothetical protein
MIEPAIRSPADSCCLRPKTLNNRHIMTSHRAIRRFTKTDPCPICGGYEEAARGQGLRCHGYHDRSGQYARCTREEHAGGLPRNSDGTYSHRLYGPCRCGRRHGPEPTASPAAGKARPAAPGTLKRRAQQRFRSFFTLTAYLRRRYGEGTTVRHWTYRDAAGGEAFRVLRIDYRAPAGSRAKSYRPCHKTSDGRWVLARPAAPLPLYNLPALCAAPPLATVTLLEGEKCADLAAAIGLPHATTSAHGAKAPQLSDWSPLAGRRVAILGDEDKDGAGYAAQIHALLIALDPPAEVRIVRLPGLAEGEDIEQFLEARRAAGRTDADILAELRGLIESAG